MRPRLVCVAAAAYLFSCAGQKPTPQAPKDEQSYEQAIAMICDVDLKVGLAAEAGILEASELRHEFLQDNVKNPDGIYFYTIFRTQDPTQQAASLRHEARDHRLKDCALADSLEREGG